LIPSESIYCVHMLNLIIIFRASERENKKTIDE
jgi:hypothetical protein